MTSTHGSGVRGSRSPSRSGFWLTLSPAALTAWPPNWLRSAAFTLAANDSSCREAKRAKSESVIAGAGTLSSIAFTTVQRPSPESST